MIYVNSLKEQFQVVLDLDYLDDQNKIAIFFLFHLAQINGDSQDISYGIMLNFYSRLIYH